MDLAIVAIMKGAFDRTKRNSRDSEMLAKRVVLRGFALISLVAIASLLPLPLSERSGFVEPAQAATSKKGHVYLVRGLINVFSRGMDTLGQKLSAKGVRQTVFNHLSWKSLTDEIIAGYRANKRLAPIVIVGHSLGGNAALRMADRLDKADVPVRLLVIFDATHPAEIPDNVTEAINYYKPSRNPKRPSNTLTPGPGFKGKIDNDDLESLPSINHINIDEATALHDRVVKKVVRIMR